MAGINGALSTSIESNVDYSLRALCERKPWWTMTTDGSQTLVACKQLVSPQIYLGNQTG